MKATSVRLEEPLAAQLEMIAKIDGLSVSDEIREAILHYIDKKREDKIFRERAAQRLSEEHQLMRDVFGELPLPAVAASL